MFQNILGFRLALHVCPWMYLYEINLSRKKGEIQTPGDYYRCRIMLYCQKQLQIITLKKNISENLSIFKFEHFERKKLNAYLKKYI